MRLLHFPVFRVPTVWEVCWASLYVGWLSVFIPWRGQTGTTCHIKVGMVQKHKTWISAPLLLLVQKSQKLDVKIVWGFFLEKSYQRKDGFIVWKDGRALHHHFESNFLVIRIDPKQGIYVSISLVYKSGICPRKLQGQWVGTDDDYINVLYHRIINIYIYQI